MHSPLDVIACFVKIWPFLYHFPKFDVDKEQDAINRFSSFQEEMEVRPRISTLLTRLSDYSNTIPAATDPDAKPSPVQSGARMGTLIGVFLPCIQNIFGVILFIRLTWVVGTAGAIQGFFIVLCCCCVVGIDRTATKLRLIIYDVYISLST